MKSKLIKTRFGDIEYTAVGKGIPVLFLHGGHSNCYETLSHKGFNTNKFHLITPSRPGYGKTPLKGNHSPRQAAALIVELLDYLLLDKVVVYGISAGGPTAIEVAGTYGDRVEKLILVSAVSKKWLDKQDSVYKTAKKIFHPKIEKITWGMVRIFSKISPGLIAKSFYPEFSKNPVQKLKKDDVQELVSTIKLFHSKKGFLNDINQEVTEEPFAGIRCPTLIIHSKNDNSVPLEHALYANALIPHSQLEILENDWGHLFWIGSDSEKSIKKTIDFIES